MLDVRFVSRLLATLVLLIPVFVAVSPTPASAEVAGTIVNYNSGKCLGVTAGGFGDGVWANQWGCVGNSSQSWTLQRVGSDTYRIINNNSGRCLDVMGGTTALADGVHVHQWICLGLGQTNQIWQLQYMGAQGGYNWYRIRAMHSGKCLGVDNSYSGDMNSPNGPPNVAPNYGMNQWGCIAGAALGGHVAQVWRLNLPATSLSTCATRSHVQRLNLQPSSTVADIMTSTVRKTVFAFPGCAGAVGGNFVAHPGAHLGLGFGGISGLVEVGYYTTVGADGAQTDTVFSEILFNNNAYSTAVKDSAGAAGLTMQFHGTPCGRFPSNDITTTFSLQNFNGSWYTSTSCPPGGLAVFPNGGVAVGLPAVEFELSNFEGVRAGGGRYADQWGFTYRGAGGATQTPTGYTCLYSVPNMSAGFPTTAASWTLSEGTGPSC